MENVFITDKNIFKVSEYGLEEAAVFEVYIHPFMLADSDRNLCGTVMSVHNTRLFSVAKVINIFGKI